MASKYTSIGGQAVIEGVMMRSPHYLAVALRTMDQSIVIREQRWKGIADRFPIFKKPFLRGVCTLIESMWNGVEALSYSANRAMAEEEAAKAKSSNKSISESDKPLSSLAIATSIFFAFAMGMGLFVALPHVLALWIGSAGLFQEGVQNPVFHIVDGVIKVAVLVAYIYLIALMKDIKRVFQYHGAEHKSIAAFEAGHDLTIENARKYSTLHPRCGTSFLLFLMINSILIFSIAFPVLGLTKLSDIAFLNHVLMVLVKIVLMVPVAAISYEFIRLSANHMDKLFFKILIAPGLLLQRLTTREPDDSQLEIALASLRAVLALEKANDTSSINHGGTPSEKTYHQLSEVAFAPAAVSEFPG